MARHFGGKPSGVGIDNKKLLLILSTFFLAMFIVLAIFLVKKGSSTSTKVVQQENTDVNLTNVLVPIRKIQKGERLTQDLFQVELRSRFGLSEGVINELRQIDGFFAKTLIVPGQPLYFDYMTKFAPTSPVEKAIPEGSRAVSIRVNDISAIEGWAKPGSIVDVQWIYKSQGKEVLKTIVEKATILSAEKSVDNTQPGIIIPSTITLLVTADDAKKIILAASNGQLSLTLRNPEDDTVDSGGTIDPASILGVPNKVPDNKPVKQQSKGTLVVGGVKYCIGVRGEMFPPDDNGNC